MTSHWWLFILHQGASLKGPTPLLLLDRRMMREGECDTSIRERASLSSVQVGSIPLYRTSILKKKRWRQMIMAENKGLEFHRVMPRTEGNFDEVMCWLLDFGRVYRSWEEVRGTKQTVLMSQIRRSPLLNFLSFLPQKYCYQSFQIEPKMNWETVQLYRATCTEREMRVIPILSW